MSRARVAVVGYGVIGRRVADAIRLQDDMELAGIAGPAASFSLRDAAARNLPVYVVDAPRRGERAARFYEARGTLADLVGRSDVVLDCTPSGVPPTLAGITGRVPTIVQGGETHASAGTSFNSMANYAEAAGRRRVRVISCSSTGAARMLIALDRAFGVEHAFVALCRRAADPGKRSRTPLNAMLPVLGASHHAADVRTVLPGLSVSSMSVDVPTTLSHLLTFQIDLRTPARRDAVLRALGRTPRVSVGRGLASTADLADDAAERGRSRRDRPEIYVFADALRAVGSTVHATIAVHMESITIPETVDAVRAVLSIEADGWKSISKTDRALRIPRLRAGRGSPS